MGSTSNSGIATKAGYNFDRGWLAPRVDLSPLAAELNAEETPPGTWEFDGVEAITPSLQLRGIGGHLARPVDSIEARVEHHLRTGAPAWNPFG